jgi:hypothetical protein
MSNQPLDQLRQKEEQIISTVSKSRQFAFEKFPLLFTLMGTFGLVATFYGFEGLIDKVDLLANNPWVLLATGVATLFFTGTLYKKLQ